MRNSAIFFALVGLILSCGNRTNSAAEISDNEQLVKQYFDYFNKHDWKAMAAMYSDSAEFKDPSLGQGIIKQSRQQIMDKYAELAALFPDVHDRVVQLYPSGERHVVVEFISTGTAPDSTKFQLPICTLFTIENGKITKDFTYYDNFEDSTNGQ